MGEGDWSGLWTAVASRHLEPSQESGNLVGDWIIPRASKANQRFRSENNIMFYFIRIFITAHVNGILKCILYVHYVYGFSFLL